jgi:hypothetical protein
VVKGCDFKGESGGYGKVESSLEATCGHQFASAAVCSAQGMHAVVLDHEV